MSVFIKLDNETVITTDTYSWQIAKPKLRKDKKTGGHYDSWTPDRYYGTLEALVNAEVEQRVRDSNAKTYAEVLVAKNNAVVALSQALRGYSYVVSVDGKRPDTGNPVNSSQVTRIPVEKGPIQ